jgi:alanine racemase
MLIDTAAIAWNVLQVKRMLGPRVALFAALKANGYGHGVVAVAGTAVDAGATGLAVGDIESAIELRGRGVRVPIIVYPGVRWETEGLELAARLDLVATVVDIDHAEQLNAAAGVPVKVVLKVDVGHERMGVPAEQVGGVVSSLHRCAMLRWLGVLGHVFEPAGATRPSIQRQLDRMEHALNDLERLGALPEYRIAVSTGVLCRLDGVHVDARLNVADPGRALLGLVEPRLASQLSLRRALRSVESELVQVRELSSRRPGGSPVQTRGRRRIGVFPMGRADGLAVIHTGQVLVRGTAAPIVGEWVEHTTVDLASVPTARVGDRVTIVGSSGDESIELEDVLGAHPQLRLVDVALAVGSRIPRVPYREGACLMSGGQAEMGRASGGAAEACGSGTGGLDGSYQVERRGSELLDAVDGGGSDSNG